MYPTQALSPLPPALLPCTPIDTPDFRYLNHSHAPLIDPLRHPFQIQMYNNMWFPSSLPSTDHPPLFKFRDVANTDALDTAAPLPFPRPTASIPAAAAIPVLPSDDPPLPMTSNSLPVSYSTRLLPRTPLPILPGPTCSLF